jgi:Na+-translocating ferredoxin:NAD+ oxidoreductase subunit G
MKKVIHMIATLSIIGIIAGGLLAGVNGWAIPLIEANKKSETERAIFLVNPEGKSYEAVPNAGFEIYKVLDDAKKVIGYSLAYEGNGFQGKIRIMLGLNEDMKNLTMYEVLEQSETPGLGSKITDEQFKKQFNGLIAEPNVAWVKGKAPSKPNEIQTITGATISSKSLVAIINEALIKARSLKEKGAL